MQKKILTTFLILFFTVIIFNINSVFGVGIVSQCWVNDIDGDGKQDLIFRTYTGPHSSTIATYDKTSSNELVENGNWSYVYGGNTKKAKWIYNTTNVEKAAIDTFKTIGLALHTAPMSNYDSGTQIGYTLNTSQLASEMITIEKAITNSGIANATPKKNTEYSDTVFYEVMRTNGTFSKINWGTGLKVSGLYAVGQTEYRYTIIRFGNNADIYVADNVIYNDGLINIISEAKARNSTHGCYISNILISKAYGKNDDYEVSRTAVDFLNQYDKKWSKATLGKAEIDTKAFESAINLYDNELIFPQLSKRTVLVRHINIGNNTVISQDIVNSGTRIKSNDISIIAGKNNNQITEKIIGKNYSVDYSGYEEYYECMLDIEQSITKNPLADTSSYKALGYNVGVSNTENGALINVQSRINSGSFTKFTDDTTSVYVPAKGSSEDSDFVVIDIYYTEYDKDVTVNHLYVDKNGYVLEMSRQNIKPNDTAIMNNNSISRINQDTYIVETYKKQLGYNVTARIADSLKEDIDKKENLYYRGYETFTDTKGASTFVGTQRINLNEATTVTLTSTNKQVNFYYYLDNQVEEQEPKKDVAGSVFVTATGNQAISGTCNDGKENITISTIPSGSKVTVGIKGIPKYMVGAITTQYVSPAKEEHTINVKLNFTMGFAKKTVEYTDLKYRVGYYKVTDMAVYKLKNTTIYDANKGYDGTSGNSLFDWANGKLSITPTDMSLKIQLTGINDRVIANNATAINNIDNYVSVNIEDKHGNKSTSGTSSSSLTREYLSVAQLMEVDANLDQIVNEEDKKYADNQLSYYDSILSQKKNDENAKQNDYNIAVDTEKGLKNALDDAEKELQRRLDVYNEASEIKSQKLVSKTNAENDLIKLQNELEGKRSELEELVIEESTALSEKNTASSNLSAVEQELQRLNGIYQDSIKLRNELAAKVTYCEDVVEKDVSIYTEEDIQIYFESDKIAALEQCKQDKLAYYKNLEDKVVENAQQAYESYRDDEYAKASTAFTNASNDYDNAVDNREKKELEISTLELTLIPSQQVIIQTISNDYTSYVMNNFTPAKNNYENYRDNQYKKAETDYNEYVKQNYVGKAQDSLEKAKEETRIAQLNYDIYYNYRKNLYNKYDEYKALYDEFMSITGSNENIAKTLGLKINIFVQNMSVKVNGTELANATKNTASYTGDLATYMTRDQVPQIKTEIPIISKDVYSNIDSTMLKEDDYSNVNKIDEGVLNGVRNLAGKAEYETQVVIGSKDVKNIVDTVYYSDQSDIDKTVVFKLKNTKLSRTYKVNTSASTTEEKYVNVKPINIYTPITVTATMESNSNQIVDQTLNTTTFDTSMIQINTPFTINLSNEEKPNTYSIQDTIKYSAGYYVKFDFDVHEVYINGKKYKNGNRIAAGTWIGIITRNKNGNAYIKAQAYGNVDSNTLDIVSEEKSSYTVRAVAYNATSTMLNRSTKYSILSDMIKSTSDLKDMLENICKNPSYFAEKEYGVVIINRAYDFKVTDVKDIGWKSVFRKSTSNSTNSHTGNLYYAGTTKWNTKSDKSNSIISRTASEIGRNPLRILPIGPYKSADTTYIKAPKLGYRFSFDMKVTGSYYNNNGKAREDKKVAITTKFYYISKDGKTYIPESDGTKKGIYLFYKTSEGKYLRIDNKGGNYDLRFTPNDGYRYIEDNATSTLSTKSLSIGNLRNLTITKDMATVANNGSYITYYGEYKLPNSTIAVLVDENGNYDINSPLKDGYIGVIFEIVAYSGTISIDLAEMPVLLSYSKNTKENQPNTSQWDYEGFLGYNGYGSKVKDGALSIKLEKGNWSITNDIYNAIKGSVMLYDIDQRAATDYE